MILISYASTRPLLAKAALLAAVAAPLLLASAASTPAAAQAAGCTDVQPMLLQRKAISDRLAKASQGKKQIDAKMACGAFGQLVANGQTLVKWIDTNKEWCQIPDAFSEGIKADHGRAVTIRAKACSVAAKAEQMQKQAKESAGGGLLGGPGLAGATRLPQGAL
ncbi:MAG: hypothetical protein JWR08_1062 [Enterovirga sp.]|jgi:hypothetical protein|nr:hypothetical protein [Enterovirga sp.]